MSSYRTRPRSDLCQFHEMTTVFTEVTTARLKLQLYRGFSHSDRYFPIVCYCIRVSLCIRCTLHYTLVRLLLSQKRLQQWTLNYFTIIPQNANILTIKRPVKKNALFPFPCEMSWDILFVCLLYFYFILASSSNGESTSTFANKVIAFRSVQSLCRNALKGYCLIDRVWSFHEWLIN